MKLSTLLLAVLLPAVIMAQEVTVKDTDKTFSEAGEDATWIYNDLGKGFAQAKDSNKPLMVVFRCIP